MKLTGDKLRCALEIASSKLFLVCFTVTKCNGKWEDWVFYGEKREDDSPIAFTPAFSAAYRKSPSTSCIRPSKGKRQRNYGYPDDSRVLYVKYEYFIYDYGVYLSALVVTYAYIIARAFVIVNSKSSVIDECISTGFG
ncbi:hypothetical protein BJV82DRAFT_583398 [Fennellomyces sp. T-0311]|nr:hypothetical protein BJV82DRAFT_583398 [Fennellomyces sp. T-0311]